MSARRLAERAFAPGRTFCVVQGDLLQEPVDAIVNAANGLLAHGGGVAGLISRAAGPALQEESDRIVRDRGRLPSGSAVATSAGRLPYKGVIHAVGPRQGEGDEEAKLRQALAAAFALAHAHGWDAVSFPAVSSGIFGVPADVCSRAYVAAARVAPIRNVRLCLRDQPLIDAVLKELDHER